MGWIIGLLIAITIILIVGLGLIFWTLDSGIVAIQKDLRALISRTNGLLDDINQRQAADSSAVRKAKYEREAQF